MRFGENLQTIRKKNQLSQEGLAEMLGVSRQAVSKWELGEGYPEVDKLLLLSKIVTLDCENDNPKEYQRIMAAYEEDHIHQEQRNRCH